MVGRLSSELIVWAGPDDALASQLLNAGTPATVISRHVSLPELLKERDETWCGVVVPPGLSALRVAESSAGLARSVGFADTLAFAGNLPGAFGFLARVSGMVQAIRQIVGTTYLSGVARLDTTGPVSWAALAALTQLRVDSIESRPDAMIGAVAHRLGVSVAPPTHDPTLTFGEDGLIVGDVAVSGQLMELHTVAAQIRLLTSREPQIEAMMKVCG